MKKLKQYIKEEIQRLSEREYDAPSEILDALQNRLEMYPLNRYISHLKAVNSIPPSYEIFLHNEHSFFIVYEDFSLMVKSGSKKFYLGNTDETNYAIKHINKLLTGPKKGSEEEDLDLLGGLGGPPKGGGSKPTAPKPPSLPKPAGTQPPPPPTPSPTPPPEEPEA